MVRSRAFQLTTEEACATIDVVTGSFHVNSISFMVLFDSGATRSFVPLVLNNKFSNAPGEPEYPLEVEIADDRPLRVSRVYRGCLLELFSERYSTDLVPIPLCENKVIVGMDLMSPNEEMID
ncbi:hypothetical protein Lser_V15G25340 [Lactuca serriola]